MFHWSFKNASAPAPDLEFDAVESFIKGSGNEEQALKDLIDNLNNKIGVLVDAREFEEAQELSLHLANATQYAADHGLFDLVETRPNYLACLAGLEPCVNTGAANPDPYRMLVEEARHRAKDTTPAPSL